MQNNNTLHLNEALSLSSERYLTENPRVDEPDLVPTFDNFVASTDKDTDYSEENHKQEIQKTLFPATNLMKSFDNPTISE